MNTRILALMGMSCLLPLAPAFSQNPPPAPKPQGTEAPAKPAKKVSLLEVPFDQLPKPLQQRILAEAKAKDYESADKNQIQEIQKKLVTRIEEKRALAKARFEKFDTNKDGTLSQEEIAAAKKSQETQPPKATP